MNYASAYHATPSRRSGLLSAVIGGHIVLFLLIATAKTVAPQIAQLPLIVDLLPAPLPVQTEPAAKPLPVASPPPAAPVPKPRPVLRPKPSAPTATPKPREEFPPALETTSSALPADNAPTVSTEPAKTPAPPATPGNAAAHGAGGTGDSASSARFDADYLRNPAPPYPPLSRKMREEGKVVLRVLVTPDGNAASVEIKTSSGSQRLDDSALRTVRNWKFIPARRGESAIESRVLVPIIFRLES